MRRLVVAAAAVAWAGSVAASDSTVASVTYRIQPGDALHVSVWHETELQKDVMVLPDGSIALPLAGDLLAAGKTIAELRGEVTERISKFIPDASVTVAVLQPLGNKIYVLGKVNRPGEFAAGRPINVMQAISMAGGTARFAATDHITILRGTGKTQTALSFDYDRVAKGEELEQNVILDAGDVVVVP